MMRERSIAHLRWLRDDGPMLQEDFPVAVLKALQVLGFVELDAWREFPVPRMAVWKITDAGLAELEKSS